MRWAMKNWIGNTVFIATSGETIPKTLPENRDLLVMNKEQNKAI